MKYYFAYGSNLNIEEMKKRCPNATRLGSSLLKGNELEFRYYLNIKEKEEGEVPIGIFLIDEKDEIKLDEYEDYPKLYYKKDVKVEFEGKTIKGLIYIMNLGARRIELPNKEYFEICLKGYKDFNFDNKYLYRALDSSNLTY